MAANSGTILSNISLAAYQALRRNGADNAFEAFTPGYTLTITCPNSATWNDATAYFFGGMAGHVAQLSADRSPIYVPRAGVVTAVVLFGYFGTAGSNENWSMYLRLNNTTDTLIATVGVNTQSRLWANYAMSLAVAQGDRLEIKTTTPTWATNPADGRFGGTIFIA